MKLCWVTLLLLSFVGAPAQDAAADPLAPFASLAGAWAMERGETVSEEFWTEAAGGVMLGLNRTVRPGRKAFFEYLRIEVRDDGVYYVAQPRGGAATAFKYVPGDGDRMVFENLAHDFPQRIIYRLEGDGLVARIEGKQNGQDRSSEWRWTRVR